MLTAYFDDSGTHHDSEVVVWAGLFANHYQWDFFCEDWARVLQNPCPGKGAVKKFHMYECHNSINEFSGWSRTETDYLVFQLGEVLIKKGIYGFACAVSRKDWDEFVHGDVRRAFGDAEGYCIRNCYIRALKWARDHTADTEIAFVFDDRPHRREENKKAFDIFQRHSINEALRPQLVSLTFSSAALAMPLQAADLFAWEYYQDSKYFLKNGPSPHTPLRRPFQKLIASNRFGAQILDREGAILTAEQNSRDPDKLRITADYFDSG